MRVSKPAIKIEEPIGKIEAATSLMRLSLAHFRGFREIEFVLEPCPIVLTGANGAGKTNVLEAISLLAPGSGLRQAKLGDMDSRGSKEALANSDGVSWAVHAEITTPQGEFSLGTGRDPVAVERLGRERRLCRINGAPVKSQSHFAEIVSLQWLVPSMDRLFDDGPSGRRRFLDRLAGNIDPAHAERVSAYETAMRERNRILRGEIVPNGTDKNIWLAGLEAEMAGQAIAIGATRLETVRLLNQSLLESSGRFPRAYLAVAGEVEEWLLIENALIVEERLQERLQDSRVEDAASGITQWGVHRSDLIVSYAGRELGHRPLAAAECSSGEQKALLISIILAEARLIRRIRGQAPILLLDEALAHLDATRSRGLFDEILDMGLQAWMTGSDSAAFKDIAGRAQFFHLDQGRSA